MMPFVMVKGENIFYEDSGQGEVPLILVHGAGGSSQRWAHQTGGIPGVRVMAVDLPGHGQSAGELRASIPEFADFILAFADAVGVDRFVLGGYSMGGAVTQECALLFPARLLGLVLIATGARLRVNPEILAPLAKGINPFADAKHLYGPGVSDDLLSTAAQDLKQVQPGVFWADFTACDHFDRTQAIEQIELPALIIGGGADVMTPVKYSQFLHAKLKNSHLLILDGAGHMCMEEQPEQVNKAIGEFVSALNGPKGSNQQPPHTDARHVIKPDGN
ncbi:MAG TPA: alpha/beta hydrolase [Verrucomicrobiae bacterium]|nr:alpha/beta hydrolase [Verrucomicrobiae bacterium]